MMSILFIAQLLTTFILGRPVILKREYRNTIVLPIRILLHQKPMTGNFFFTIGCKTREMALKIEKHIKSMKKREYYFNLKKHPGIVCRLKEKYQG